MENKIISDKVFNTMMEFKLYCEDQGEDDSLGLIDDICGDIRIMFEAVQNKWPVVLEIMGPSFIMTIFGAEQIIDRGLSYGMSRKKYYKEIYKDVRGKVELFAELHGKSEVISKQLAIETTK